MTRNVANSKTGTLEKFTKTPRQAKLPVWYQSSLSELTGRTRMSVHRIIWVSPLADGWAVLCSGLEPLVFRSGARAEAQARHLAVCLARLGQEIQVRVLDRARNLVGAQLYPAY